MDRVAWQATGHGIAKSWTQLTDQHQQSFPQWLYQFSFPPIVQEVSLFSPHPLQHLFIACRLFFDDGYSDRCEVMFHCDLDLHFFNMQFSKRKKQFYYTPLKYLCLFPNTCALTQFRTSCLGFNSDSAKLINVRQKKKKKRKEIHKLQFFHSLKATITFTLALSLFLVVEIYIYLIVLQIVNAQGKMFRQISKEESHLPRFLTLVCLLKHETKCSFNMI